MAENDAKQDALFVNLVLVFKSAAMQQMGKTINPLTGKVERNLDQARFSIDTLEMLKDKTAGNLSHELERLLDSTLLELRMNYVEEAKAGEAAGPQAESAQKAEAEAETESAPKAEAEPGKRPKKASTGKASGKARKGKRQGGKDE